MLVRYFVILFFVSGCYGKFIKAAPNLNTATLKVQIDRPAEVQLGQMDGGGLIGAVVNVVQAVRSGDQTKRIREAINEEDLINSVYGGVGEGLSDGVPFRIVEEQPSADAMVILNIRRHGMYVAEIGMPGQFMFVGKLRIFDQENKKLYRKRLKCAAAVGDPSVSAQVLQVVNNVKQLKSMSDEEINLTFMAIADFCGYRFAEKMRQHSQE